VLKAAQANQNSFRWMTGSSLAPAVLLIPPGETGLACDEVFASLVTILKNA
jgi:hypothetical protein